MCPLVKVKVLSPEEMQKALDESSQRASTMSQQELDAQGLRNNSVRSPEPFWKSPVKKGG